VLSGFLIGGILLDHKESQNYYTAFYLRRVHRILPIYYLYVIFYGALAWIAASNVPIQLQLSPLSASYFPVHFAFLQNILHKPGTIFTNQCLSQLWSLAVEEQFYLVIPLLVRYLTKRMLVVVLILAVLAAPILRSYLFLHGHPGAMYVWTPARMDALSLGVLAAVAWRTPHIRGWIEKHPGASQAMLVGPGLGWAALAAFAPKPESLLMASIGFSVIALFFVLL